MSKKITQSQYYQLVGLMAAHAEQQKILKALERAAVAITDERDREGNPEYGGHTSDILWDCRELQDGLRILDIEVETDG